MKQLYELKGEGRSIRAIARDLGVSRNSVRKYLRSPQIPKAKEQAPRGSELDPYKEYLRERLVEGLENCVVLLRELRRRGYTGGRSAPPLPELSGSLLMYPRQGPTAAAAHTTSTSIRSSASSPPTTNN